MAAVAMSNRGGSQMNTMAMAGAHSRPGGAQTGLEQGAMLSNAELQYRKHYVQPSNTGRAGTTRADALAGTDATERPYYYNQYESLPVPYSAPSEQKEHMVLKSAIRDAAGKEIEERGHRGVIRTDPITEEEVQYLKSMKDQAELAKFDDYVETLINPRQPGNMKWLMEIYPDYVERRLQQAHTDYEFALRNQMIDSWGINTFQDLHFKYLVDQGKVTGPSLNRAAGNVNDMFTPGWLSPFNFQSPNKDLTYMSLPYASARHGKTYPRGNAANAMTMNRLGRPLGQGNTEQELARGMYEVTNPATGGIGDGIMPTRSVGFPAAGGPPPINIPGVAPP